MSTVASNSALLRSHHLRVTPQRLAVANLLFSKPLHITARDAFETLRVNHPGLSMNTIYLTLGQFESAGLLQSFELGGNRVFDSNTHPHDHACCSRCGTIVDLKSSAASQALPSTLSQWRIDSAQRILIGLCPACSARNHV